MGCFMQLRKWVWSAVMAVTSVAALTPGGGLAQSSALPTPAPLLPSAAAATRPATTTGRLIIRAVQKSAGAPVPSRSEAAVHFRGQGQQLAPMTIFLDERGTAVLQGIPLNRIPTTPIVVVEHAGIRYQAAGQPLSLAFPERVVEIPVYETTERVPEWRMPARKVTVENVGGGVRVVDVMWVENSGDRTWISGPDVAGKRSTFAVQLPSGARELQFGGDFSEEQTRFDGSMLRHSAPLVPGVTRFEVAYVLPATAADVVVPITTPAALGELNVLVADRTGVVAVTGLDSKGVVDVGGMAATKYQAANLKPSDTVSLTVSATGVAALAVDNSGSSILPKVVAGAVMVGLLVAGAVVMFLKSTRQPGEIRPTGVCNRDH